MKRRAKHFRTRWYFGVTRTGGYATVGYVEFERVRGKLCVRVHSMEGSLLWYSTGVYRISKRAAQLAFEAYASSPQAEAIARGD